MEEIYLLTFQKELHFEIRICQLGMEGLVEYNNFTRLSVRHKKNIISFIFYQKILYQFIYKKKEKSIICIIFHKFLIVPISMHKQ